MRGHLQTRGDLRLVVLSVQARLLHFLLHLLKKMARRQLLSLAHQGVASDLVLLREPGVNALPESLDVALASIGRLRFLIPRVRG